MPLIFDINRSLYRPHAFQTEAEFEKQVVSGAANYSLQGPTYVQREKLLAGKTLEDVLTLWRRS